MNVHPDKTAIRAVDACGGTYSAAEIASGYAAGHTATLCEVMSAVVAPDALTAELLQALAEARTTLSILRTQVMVEIGRCPDPSESRWEGVPEKIKERIEAAGVAIANATGGLS